MASVHDKSDFRPDINGLRALAVAAVVAFHFNLPGSSGGFLGVDVFFVISGFLMSKIIVGKLQAGKFSVADFWMARARRIFPALAVLCAVLLPFGWVSLDPADYQKLSLHAASSLAFLSNFTFWQEAGYFDSASREKWLLHTWSLSVEWQFYFVFPLVLMAVWKVFGSRRALVIAVAAALLLSLALSIVGTHLRPIAAYYLLPTRAWEMMAGGLAYMASLHFTPRPALARLLEWSGLAAIVAGIFALDSRDEWPGYLALIPVLGTVSVILARNTSSVLTGNAGAQFIGDTSYSIYLWHWPIIVLIGLEGIKDNPAWIAAGIAMAVALGYLSFRFVESPVRRMQAGSRLKEFGSYATVAVALICVAAIVYRGQGFPSRLNADEGAYRDALAAVGDWGHPDEHCQVRIYFTRCLSEGQSQEQILFIGDSLTEQWYPRYGHARVDKHYTTLFLTKGACLPIRGVESMTAGANCAEFANAAWAEVFERKPRKLVISSIWLTYFFTATGAVRDGVCLMDASGCAPVLHREQLDAVFALFERDVRRAVAEGMTVYIVGPTPQSGTDYPKAKRAELAARELPLPVVKVSLRERTATTFANDRALYSQGTIADLLGAVSERTGAALIMPEHYMCPSGVCPNVDAAGKPIFKDRGHLRKTYVQSEALSWLDRAIGIGP